MNDSMIKEFISQLSSLTNRIWQIGDLLAASELHEWAREQRKVAEGLGVVIAGLNGCVGGMELAEEKPSLDARLECLESLFIHHCHDNYEQQLNNHAARLREIEKDLELTSNAVLALSPVIDKHEATLHQMNAELTIDNPNNYGYRLSKLEDKVNNALSPATPEEPLKERSIHFTIIEQIMRDIHTVTFRVKDLEYNFETFRQAFVKSLEADKEHLKYQAGFKEL